MSYYNEIKNHLLGLLADFNKSSSQFDLQLMRLEKEKENINQLKSDVLRLASERQIGFPWLAHAYDEFYKLQDRKVVDFLKYKSHSAVSASEVVRTQTRLRRQAEKDLRISKYILEYYEHIAPFLVELREEIDIQNEENSAFLNDYTIEEKSDEVTNFLTKEEYRKLTNAERNQLALDRFWKRPKSKWMIGRLYERYVGQLFELQGYLVEYVGIFKGYEDLGRDLICQKGNEIIIIQCKNWSKFRTVYEKHIFQFFGTVFQYKDSNPDKKVRAIFYTSTKVSELAQRFAIELGIELIQEEKMDLNYPCIKCNISQKDSEKIYHLPFDQQYDRTKIEPHKGEFYCKTVAEAENAGFRRALRHVFKNE